LPNRRAVDLIVRKELLRRVRTPCPVAVGLIDADYFGLVNKTYSQTAGDQVLVWLAGVLTDAIRASDSLGRVGGEEFMVVAPETDAAGAAALGERLRSQVEAAHTTYTGRTIRMTISIGFAAVGAGVPAGYDQLRELAADALKEAKESGRNRCVVRTLQVAPVPTPAPGTDHSPA
jgi:diguanylate cyclase (GGDEF)-like protein